MLLSCESPWMITLLVLFACRSADGECHDPTLDGRKGSIIYQFSEVEKCHYSIHEAKDKYNVLVIELKRVRLTVTSPEGRKTIGGILTLPEIGGVVNAGDTHCFVYMKANCNASATRLKIHAYVPTCAKSFLLTEMDELPANRSISINSFLEGSKRVTLIYKYGICVKNQGSVPPTSRSKKSSKRVKTPESRNVSYPVAVSLLALILAGCLGVIFRMQMNYKKLSAAFVAHHVAVASPSTRSPEPDIYPDTAQAASHSETTRFEDKPPVYASIHR